MKIGLLHLCLLYLPGLLSQCAAEDASPCSNAKTKPQSACAGFHLFAPAEDVARTIATAYGKKVVIVGQLTQKRIRFDTSEANFESSIQLLRLATKTLIVPLDESQLLVVADTPANRKTYLRRLQQTIYLPGLSQQQIADSVSLATNLLGLKQVSAIPGRGSLIAIGTQPQMEEFRAVLAQLWQGRAEFSIDMQIYEVDKSRTAHIGVQLPQSTTFFNVNSEVNELISQNQAAADRIVSSGLAKPGDNLTIAAILIEEGYGSGVLTEPFALFGGGFTLTGVTFGSVTANLSLSGSEARSLYATQARVQEAESAILKFGTRYPIKVSDYTVTNYDTSSGKNLSSQVTPQVQYQDLGINAKITPTLIGGRRILLKLDMEISALGGTSINGAPVLTSRTVSTEMAVKDGTPASVASLLSVDNRKSSSGLPGIDAEFAGSDTNGTRDRSELVVIITPRLTRLRSLISTEPMLLDPMTE